MVLSPLPWGANRPWVWDGYMVLIALLTLQVSVQLWRGKANLPINHFGLKWALLLFAIPVLWACLQTVSWVPADWKNPFWSLAEPVLHRQLPGAISVLPYETITALQRLLMYGLVFMLSLYFHQDSERARNTMMVLANAGMVYAIYGLVMYWGRFDNFLWIERDKTLNVVSSTFINRNNYATYAGLMLLAVFPQLYEKLKNALQFGINSHFGRQYLLEKLLLKGWWPLLMIVVGGTALLLTESRGGFLSTALATLVFVLLMALSGRLRFNFAVPVLVLVVLLSSLTLFQTSGDGVLERLNQIDVENNERLRVYQILVDANRNQSGLGMGYGSFEKSFRIYRSQEVQGYYDKAHNNYLENIFELGQIPAGALFAAIAWLAGLSFKGFWLRKRHWLYPAIGFAATILVASHALVDFSLQIPAVAMTYGLIMGVAIAQSVSSKHKTIKINTHQDTGIVTTATV